MHRITEAETRKELIDPKLENAGWFLRDHTKVRIEIPVDGYDAAPWNGVTDYAVNDNGEVLAVVEAKKTAVNVRLVRFDNWQAIQARELQVCKNIRRTLFKYKLHQDTELFEKAYGYIKEYY